MPSNPDQVYTRDGVWTSWPDWLGYESNRLGKGESMLPFEDARAIVHGLGLKGTEAWRDWRKSGLRSSSA